MPATFEHNAAFIDSQNVYLGVRGMGWKLDFKRFRKYLFDKYRVEEALLFIGYTKANKPLYDYLKWCGYRLIFKPVVNSPAGIKGNVDAELVLHTMHELSIDSYDKAVIVSGDGDFTCLVEYLDKRNKLLKVVAPSHKGCSSLLLKVVGSKVVHLDGMKNKLESK